MYSLAKGLLRVAYCTEFVQLVLARGCDHGPSCFAFRRRGNRTPPKGVRVSLASGDLFRLAQRGCRRELGGLSCNPCPPVCLGKRHRSTSLAPDTHLNRALVHPAIPNVLTCIEMDGGRMEEPFWHPLQRKWVLERPVRDWYCGTATVPVAGGVNGFAYQPTLLFPFAGDIHIL